MTTTKATPTDTLAAAGLADPEERAPYVDPLGLTLYTDNILTQKPSGILYGPAGSGKSTECAIAFNKCLWLVSSATVLRPFASYVRENWEKACDLGWRTPVKPVPNPKFAASKPEFVWGDPTTWKNELPTGEPNARLLWVERRPDEGGMAIKVIPEMMPDGVTLADNWTFLSQILYRYCAACQGKAIGADNAGNLIMVDTPKPVEIWYEGVAIDELSTIFDRIYAWMNLLAQTGHPLFTTDKGKSDTWAVPREFSKFVRRVFSLPQTTNRTLVGVSHEKSIQYEGAIPSPGKRKGDMKYLGGPAMPTGTTIAMISAAVDWVLRTTIEEAANTGPVDMGDGAPKGDAGPAVVRSTVKRRYWTEIGTDFYCKFRDFVALPEEDFGLRELLLRAGYAL